jgi:hypothetical protein
MGCPTEVILALEEVNWIIFLLITHLGMLPDFDYNQNMLPDLVGNMLNTELKLPRILAMH